MCIFLFRFKTDIIHFTKKMFKNKLVATLSKKASGDYKKLYADLMTSDRKTCLKRLIKNVESSRHFAKISKDKK